MRRFLQSLAFVLVTPASAADTPLTIGGFVDLNAALNPNRQQNHENFMRGTAKLGNEFSINLAAIDVVREPQPVRFHLSVVAGSAADVVHASEPGNTAANRVGAGAYTGFAQKRWEATLTYEYRPSPNLILKFEGRQDHSTGRRLQRVRRKRQTRRLSPSSARS